MEKTMTDTSLPLVQDNPAPLQGVRMPPGGAPDWEVAAIMERLSDLQTLLTLNASRGPDFCEAITVVQGARCLIVERLFPNALRVATLSPPPALT